MGDSQINDADRYFTIPYNYNQMIFEQCGG